MTTSLKGWKSKSHGEYVSKQRGRLYVIHLPSPGGMAWERGGKHMQEYTQQL